MLRYPIYVVNLAREFGGGELYTSFFTRALRQLSESVVLVCRPDAGAFRPIIAEGVAYRFVVDDESLLAALDTPGWVITHTKINESAAQIIQQRHWLSGFAHMPFAGRAPGVLGQYDQVYAVSRYVQHTLAASGVVQIYPYPLYGIADFTREVPPHPITQGRVYISDKRKLRDNLVSALEPIFTKRRTFARRPGITLGIVSAIGPIKQFELLFEHIAPALAAHRAFNIEIFGRGGVKSVQSLKQALRPLKGRARLWGHQANPQPLFAQFDYLLSGLPEKEALGLNLIEAQCSGIPVIAVNAAPFTETVLHGQTGWLYTDPRIDGGQDFRGLVTRLAADEVRPNPLDHPSHLAQFQAPAFAKRVAAMVQHAQPYLDLRLS
jgi:glycosyltransferase involved in cell wall biosynthesis